MLSFTSTSMSCCRNKSSYENGIWFGGVKYTLVRQQDIDVEGQNVVVYFCSRPGGGACIACSKDSVVVGFSDKKKGQEGGNSQKKCPRHGRVLAGHRGLIRTMDQRSESDWCRTCCDHVSWGVL